MCFYLRPASPLACPGLHGSLFTSTRQKNSGKQLPASAYQCYHVTCAKNKAPSISSSCHCSLLILTFTANLHKVIAYTHPFHFLTILTWISSLRLAFHHPLCSCLPRGSTWYPIPWPVFITCKCSLQHLIPLTTSSPLKHFSGIPQSLIFLVPFSYSFRSCLLIGFFSHSWSLSVSVLKPVPLLCLYSPRWLLTQFSGFNMVHTVMIPSLTSPDLFICLRDYIYITWNWTEPKLTS